MNSYIALLITFLIVSNASCYDVDENLHNHNHSMQHSLSRHKSKSRPKDFLIVDRLSDNEQETRILWNNMAGKETLMLGKQVLENETDSAMRMTSLWQLTDGFSFAQLIFSNQRMIDCEYLEDGTTIAQNFMAKFIKEYRFIRKRQMKFKGNINYYAYEHNNETVEEIDYDLRAMKANSTYRKIKRIQDIPQHLIELMSLQDLKAKCSVLHSEIKAMMRAQESHESHESEESEDLEEELEKTSLNRPKRHLKEFLMAPNTKWCGRGNSANTYSDLGGSSSSDVCCRRHDHCKMTVQAFKTKYNFFNMRPFTVSHCRCDRRRSRRDLNNFLMVPHTKWCGRGWTAKKYAEIGGFSNADRCCRQHDKFCSHWILGFQMKYQLFNWSINTIMHCKCDERFRTCLKMAGSSDANMVGKLFFNIVQIKCFVLKPEKFCILNSWWGKCMKYKIKKRAHLRENHKY